MKKFKEFFEESKQNNEILSEGGNIFKGKTGPIKKENIEPTVQRYFDELKKVFPKKKHVFNKQHFKYVGSVGKKPQSGDIDFAVDSSVIIDKNFSDKSIKEWGFNPAHVRAQFDKYKKRSRSASDGELMIRSMLFHIVHATNKKAPNLYFNEKKINVGSVFGLYPQYNDNGDTLGTGVQMDWLIGPGEWLEFSYYSNTYKDNVKGLHRTQLLVAIFQSLDLAFQHGKGITDKKTKELIATKPNEAVDILNDRLGLNLNKRSINDYFKVIDEIRLKLSPAQFTNILHEYFKILQSTRADIPMNLQNEWLELNKKHNYNTKFLPDTSALLNRIGK